MSGKRDMCPRLAPCFVHRTAVAMSVSFDRPPRATVAGDGWVPALDTRLRSTGLKLSLYLFPRLSPASCALGGIARVSALSYRSAVRLLGVPVRVGSSMPSACSRVW